MWGWILHLLLCHLCVDINSHRILTRGRIAAVIFHLENLVLHCFSSWPIRMLFDSAGSVLGGMWENPDVFSANSAPSRGGSVPPSNR